jgi:FMN-dependent NADH-azoreductase
MRLLRIDSSAREHSVSRQLTSEFVESWKVQNPDGEVVERDLACTRLPHITDDWMATFSDPSKLTSQQREYLSTSNELVQELLGADIILIGAPMYNFTISWELKAWIDQVVRVGKTIAYDSHGARGLVKNKKVLVVTSRGGSYTAGTPRFESDFQEPYLRRILAFMGLADVTFIHAENQSRSEQAKVARAAASEQIARAVVQADNPSGERLKTTNAV